MLDVVVESCKIIKSLTMDGVRTNRLSCQSIEGYPKMRLLHIFLGRSSLPPIYVSKNYTARQKIQER